MHKISLVCLVIVVLSETLSGTDQQPTSFSITPDAVRIGECYTIQVENGARMTLDLRYTHNEGDPQTIIGWPTLDGEGTATACPTRASQLGNYEFTGYKNTQASAWLTSSETLEVIEALEDTDFSSTDGSYWGQVSGIAGSAVFADVTVVLTSDGVLKTTSPDSSGQFEFQGLADGNYVVKISKPGYRPPPARSFQVSDGGQVDVSAEDRTFHLEPLAALDTGLFVFHWEEDQSRSGYEYSAHVNKPLDVEFLEQEATAADSAAAGELLFYYNITLADDGDAAWTQEHAYRLLQTMEAIPQTRRDPDGGATLPASKWIIASEHVEDDIRIDTGTDGSRIVSIAEETFVNATPRIARVEGKRGAYYSKRLHHALVRFVTDNGRDEKAFEKILQQRFGVTTRITDYRELTGEPPWRFQEFHAEEIVEIINNLEEMPSGLRDTPGLDYLVRRLDGTPNPVYPTAPAIAWVTLGYIEFMDFAFLSSSTLHMHRLIIHEKAHFLWEHLFEDQLKDDWIELGGWYRDPLDPDGWSTTKQTEFASAYAHGENPNEDMAESIAYFVVTPDKLRSRSPGKYEFVRDRIMQGSFYLAKIPEDLTFKVYNLYPDYVFPGKIRRVDITVSGAPEEDKNIRVEIELHALDGVLEGAKHAFARIYSGANTSKDLVLYPVGVPKGMPGTILSGSFTLSRYAKAGYWRPDQIRIVDEHSNERLEGVNDFGWRLYVNNPLEDVIPPEYVENTASLTKSVEMREGREVQLIEATWEVQENSGVMRESWPCFASLNPATVNKYSFKRYGHYDPQESTCRVTFVMPHYMPSSVYTWAYLTMEDRALNTRRVYFRDPDLVLRDDYTILDEAGPEIELVTNNPDAEPPELDVDGISIHAGSTRPDDPNGETLVILRFRVRDNLSGFTHAALFLRNPQGVSHAFFADDPEKGNLFPSADPSQWADHTWSVTLPAGSAPGIWGLTEMTVWDRAENFKAYDFTEIIHFDVE